VLRGAYTSRRIIRHKCSRELTIICGHRPFSLTSRKEEEKEALLGKKPPTSYAKRSQPKKKKSQPKKKTSPQRKRRAPVSLSKIMSYI